MIGLWNAVKSRAQQLRWKLAFSYAAVTVGALLVSMVLLSVIILSSILLAYDAAPVEMWVQAAEEQVVPLARMFLSEEPLDMEGIAELVNYRDTAQLESLDLFRVGNIAVYVRAIASYELLMFDAEGTLLGRTGLPALPEGGLPWDRSQVPRLEVPLDTALSGLRDPNRLVATGTRGEQWAIAVPVLGIGQQEEELLGAVAYIVETVPTDSDVLPHALGLLGRSLVLFLLGAALLGTAFGTLTARGMMRRFDRLSDAAHAWSKGNFSEIIDDDTGDEISQLAGRFNSMAEQLIDLLARRQEMAISEERNRLARDLHDSAKQQALAASFQLGTSVTLFDRDPQAARAHLLEGSNLVDSVRRELTDLIHELRPPMMNGQDLAESIQTYAAEWAHQNDVITEVEVDSLETLTLEQKQTVFRTVQEALANVARHSSASTARVTLLEHENLVTLTISDDGSGFDTGEQRQGMGLHSMRERAESLGGELRIESEPGLGTRVVASFPRGNPQGGDHV
jgi:signal transduction histidine kinase